MADRGVDLSALPKEVRDQLAELDLELSEGKGGGERAANCWGNSFTFSLRVSKVGDRDRCKTLCVFLRCLSVNGSSPQRLRHLVSLCANTGCGDAS